VTAIRVNPPVSGKIFFTVKREGESLLMPIRNKRVSREKTRSRR
jgi:hypothetical protein